MRKIILSAALCFCAGTFLAACSADGFFYSGDPSSVEWSKDIEGDGGGFFSSSGGGGGGFSSSSGGGGGSQYCYFSDFGDCLSFDAGFTAQMCPLVGGEVLNGVCDDDY